MDENAKTEKTNEKKDMVKVKNTGKINIRHSGKLYKKGEIFECTKDQKERLAKINGVKIEEVK
jgi:hypothetical protein